MKTPCFLRGVRGDQQLETLPNIDINIKHGNSLISRFALNSDLKTALKKNNCDITTYQNAVNTYRNAENKAQKREITSLIDNIKSNFSQSLYNTDPKKVKLRKLENELYNLENQLSLLPETKKEEKAREKKINQLQNEIDKLKIEIEEIENGKLYRNAFEWRFEFPEVLNDQGDFIGFDLIIGNPPYIRQEEFSAIKSILKQQFSIYNSIADLLTYFVELGYNLLNKNGVFQFIISNKFTRANYGKQMRSFLLENTQVTHFIDFSGLAIFDEATVDASILGFVKQKSTNNHLLYADFDKYNFNLNAFTESLVNIKQDFLQANLSENSWSFEDDQVLQIKQKIEAQGIPLKDWNISISRGIVTGFNEAFIIDGKKRQELITKDAKSEEIIKPLLRGRDINKYYPNYQDLWVITTFPSKKIKIDDFLAVKEYLLSFGERLHQSGEKGSRKKTTNQWFETSDNIAYWQDFEKPKILYPEFSSKSSFTYDEKGIFYTLDTCWILNNGNYYLLSLLNSNLMWFYLKTIVSVLGTQAFRMKKIYLENLPIKQITEKQEKPFIKLVNEILKIKKNDPNTDTSKLEREIDLLVYELYELTEAEIKIVEGN